jgi:hypothetical protein
MSRAPWVQRTSSDDLIKLSRLPDKLLLNFPRQKPVQSFFLCWASHPSTQDFLNQHGNKSDGRFENCRLAFTMEDPS